jgi:hypothetical protein
LLSPDRQEKEQQMIIRLYSGEDGQSHFEEITGPWVADDRGREQTPLQDAVGVRFTRYPVGFFSDWHPAARRMYAMILSG